MKEFYGTTGGRTAFNEDFLALRDLVLSLHHIFDGCEENFIISGCDVGVVSELGNNFLVVESGYVWLSGKIRAVKKTKIQNANRVYIIVSDNVGQTINYATKGIFGEMSFDYGTALSTEVPSGEDYIMVSPTETPRNIRNVLFNKYIATKSAAETQVINDEVNFINGLTSTSIKFPQDNRYVLMEASTDGELILSIYSNNVLSQKYIISNGIKCIYSDERYNIYFPGDDDTDYRIMFRDLKCHSVDYDTVKGGELYLDKVSFDDIFYKKWPSRDWTSLVWTDDFGSHVGDIASLKIKSIGKEHYIAGILPINDNRFKHKLINYDQNTKIACFKTNIAIPFLIMASNTEYTDSINGNWVVRGENITIKNTCTIWYIDSRRLCYKTYLENENDEGKGVGIPCPASVFWDFIF